MPTNFQDIIAFHTKFGMDMPESPILLPTDVCRFRTNFLIEELSEYSKAVADSDIELVIDSLIDLSYVALGTAFMHGINDWDELQEAMYPVRQTNDNSKRPHLIVPEFSLIAVDYVTRMISAYEQINAMTKDNTAIPNVAKVLSTINHMCITLSVQHGFDWQPHWDEVHKCNMAKERSSGKDDKRSKRGHELDVVKPEGWVGPNHLPIIELKKSVLEEKH